MKLLAILTMLTLVGTLTTVSTVNAQNITDTKDNGCPKHGFGSDADFCGGADYIHNDNKNIQKEKDNGCPKHGFGSDADFCSPDFIHNDNKNKDNNKQSSDIGKITVGYGDVGSYYGKGKVVIKNLDTGETLVTHDLNFAKQHHNQGPDCCVKVYTFDKSGTHHGDRISANVTGGGGSWESGTYNYKNNLRMSITLDEIGE